MFQIDGGGGLLKNRSAESGTARLHFLREQRFRVIEFHQRS
jgi:hypothetical protein